METAINPSEHRTDLAITTSGMAIEHGGGIAVVVLTILALAGVAPALLTSIAGIIFGAAMLIAGIAIAGAWSRLASFVAQSGGQAIEFGSGVGVEMLVGIAAIALGILALVGVSSGTLLSALIITGGGGLLLSAGTTQRLNDLHMISQGHSDTVRHVAHEALVGGAAAQVLGGIGAIVLGILALVSTSTVAEHGYGTLAQVGLLVLGASVVMASGALTGKMGRLYRAG